ncbi:lasso peptide biosynthesis B2 protein [Paenibacillus sp. UNC451MF]|uniref:lasso peptide biosynthesis B2 protein n=1 Tax=Paenibacillus sp. UNC451MF TaxID=1449063 RepID=UPI000490E77F|nr:lasso peptide biosynthesis B2 protein [Paenibacillus sp. UNC451MF]
MGIVSKVKKFLQLDMATMLLIAEAIFYLGWARMLVSIPFAKVAPSLGAHMQETSNSERRDDIESLIKVHDIIRVMSQHTFWESKCLVRAIAALKMLERRHIESTLYLGTARDEQRKMIAHAWLRSGPFYITGAEEMERFQVVGTFAKRISDKGN